MRLLLLSLLLLGYLTGCSPKGSTIDSGFLGGVALSAQQSAISISSSTVLAGGSVTVQLFIKDQNGNPFYVPGSNPKVVFSTAGGTSTGSFGSVTDSQNGTYTAIFTGIDSGTATTISASVDGTTVNATASIHVTPGNYSLSSSFVTLSAATVTAGSTITVTLHSYDTSNNALTMGGLSVSFSKSGGTSSGSFSATTDNGDGTYTATFTGTTAGTATGIGALIGVSVVTSAAPTVIVTNGAAAAIAVSSGSGQSATVGTALGSALVALVSDSHGNAVSGVTVDWTVTGTGALFGASSTTGGTGLASNTLTMGTVTGSYTITATIHGTSTSTTFTETGISGSASQVIFSQQPTGNVNPNVNLPQQPIISIEDANGNLVTSGADATSNVTLTISSGTGNIVGTATVAAVNGVATFSGISLDTQGSGKVLTATKANTVGSGGTTAKSGTSNSFTINTPAPGAFVISSATAGSSNVVLTWGASSDAASYSITYGTTSGGPYGTTFSSNATSPTTVTGLTPGTKYYFMVTATNVTTSTNATAEKSATPLAAFTITSATPTAADTVRLIWASSTGASSYTVSYGTSSGSYGTTFSTNAASPTDVTGLTAGTTYYFMVKAVNSSGSVNATAEASAAPAAPVTITSITPGLGSATLVWGSVAGATSYDILYGTSSGLVSGTYASSVAGTTSGTAVTGLSSGTTYYFRVRANYAYGSVLSTNELSTAVYQSFTLPIPFTYGTDSSYTFSNSSAVSLMSSNGVQLTPADQSDAHTNTGSSANSGGFENGTMAGVQWDSGSDILRLNTTTNQASHDAGWTPQWSSLIGYWKLDEAANSATVADSSGGSGSGTVTGTATLGASGKLSTAMSLAGTGYVDVGTPASLNISSNITIAAWVYLGDTTTSEAIVAQGSTAHTWPYALYVNATAGKLTFYSDNGSQHSVTSNATLTAGTWHHVAVVSTGTAVSFYIDGVADSLNPQAITQGSAAGTADFQIGAQNKAGETGKMVGTIDDVAFWSTTLTATQIQTIYQRQSAKYAGQFTSRVFDALSSQAWTTLSLTSTLPFLKELPGSTGSETSSTYSSQSANLMTSLLGYYKFDEASYNGTSGEVKDSSSNNYAAAFSSAAAGSANGLFGRGTSSATLAASSTYLTANFTINIWADPSTLSSSAIGNTILDFLVNGTTQSLVVALGNSGYFQVYNANNATTYSSASPISTGSWSQLTLSYDGTCLQLYVNGTTSGACSAITITAAGSTRIRMGSNLLTATPYAGILDELGFWSRALTGPEVLELYRRGANRLKYQIRTCSASDCSDQQALTASGYGWKGPDNSQLSYFSELYNTASNALGAAVSTGTPTMTFSNFSGSGLSVSSNRYVQYRAILESDDANSLCTYNSSAAACSPELQSASLGPTHYDTSKPYIISNASIGSLYQTLSGFTETPANSGNCSAGATYALSSNGSTFYYWNGSAWALSSDYSTSSSGATIISNIASFPSSAAGTGTLQIKTFLNSSGTSSCQVTSLSVTGQKY